MSPRAWRAALVAVVLLAGTFRAAADDLPAIKARGVLKIAFVRQVPTPEFLSFEPGNEPGFDREVLEGFARAHGLVPEFVSLSSWDQLVPALLERRADMIAGRVSSTEARAKLVDFTAEVFPTRDVMFSYPPQPTITTREQLLALPKVAALRGSSMAESLTSIGVPASRIVYPDPPASMPDRVQTGALPAGAWVLEAAMVWQRSHPGLQLGLFIGPPQSLAYGVPKQTPQLLAALNSHIRLVKESGTWNRLAIKYFGQQAPAILKRARETTAP